LIIDLGAARDLTGGVLQWGSARPSAYTLDASSDGQHWQGVADVTSGAGASDQLSFATSARYVRLTEQVPSNSAPALEELSVTGRGTSSPGASGEAGGAGSSLSRTPNTGGATASVLTALAAGAAPLLAVARRRRRAVFEDHDAA
jgi:hypothetical protein